MGHEVRLVYTGCSPHLNSLMSRPQRQWADTEAGSSLTTGGENTLAPTGTWGGGIGAWNMCTGPPRSAGRRSTDAEIKNACRKQKIWSSEWSFKKCAFQVKSGSIFHFINLRTYYDLIHFTLVALAYFLLSISNQLYFLYLSNLFLLNAII